MTRFLCTLALTCLAANCVPPKAAEVVETPATPAKPNSRSAIAKDDPTAGPRRTGEAGGMQLPDLTGRLPDRKDMTPTAPPTSGGGVIATPPSSEKRVSE